MHRILRSIFVAFCGTAALWVASLAVTAAPSNDPVLGVWKLNWDKSNLAGASGYTNIMRKYELAGEGVRITEIRADRTGHTIQVQYAVHYDGKPYPVYTAEGEKGVFRKTDETMELRRLDRYTVAGVARRNGKVLYTFTRVLSSDATTLMVRVVEPDAQGQERVTLLVYERLRLT